MMITVAIFAAALGAVFLILGIRRVGWRLLGIAVLLAVVAPVVVCNVGRLVAGFAPAVDTLLSLVLITALLYLVGTRRTRSSSHKDRVDRSQ